MAFKRLRSFLFLAFLLFLFFAGSVLLLTKQTTLSSPAATRLKANKAAIGTVHFIGGTAAVSQSVRDAAMDQLD